jgi:hypothetical protein
LGFLKRAIRIHAALESHPWLSKVLKKSWQPKTQSNFKKEHQIENY